MKHPSTGLVVPRKDPRNFSYTKYFGAVLPLDVPDFIVGKVIVKDQKGDGSCTAFSATSVSEAQEEVELEPAYTWYKTAEIGGYNPRGADPDDVCKSLTKYGSLTKDASPYHLPDDGGQVAIKDWDGSLDLLAQMHKKKSWFKIDGVGDMFDNIRNIMWQDRDKKIRVFCGIYWQPSWTHGTGICQYKGSDKSLPHAVAIIGQKTILGVPYLVVLNSWGTLYGDGGLFYFSREVANTLVFARAFYDVDPNEVKKETWGILQFFVDWILRLFTAQKKTEMIIQPEPPKKESKIKEWAKAIEEFENAPKEWNNPGAIKSTSGNFLKFKTYDAGFNYLCDYLERCATGRHKAYPLGGETTILQFFRIYAPASDKNMPDHYADVVATELKVAVDTKIKTLL